MAPPASRRPRDARRRRAARARPLAAMSMTTVVDCAAYSTVRSLTSLAGRGQVAAPRNRTADTEYKRTDPCHDVMLSLRYDTVRHITRAVTPVSTRLDAAIVSSAPSLCWMTIRRRCLAGLLYLYSTDGADNNTAAATSAQRIALSTVSAAV